ncbi:hypothetical protein [Bacillus sp. FSL K6-6540]|uniref:hypothetical protein n=1 Tax=Bacillus sp. FSL K6-6540 TaxID=2921512 RepID=UPI0030F4E421
MFRHNAYEMEYMKSGPLCIQDGKGRWTAGSLRRLDHTSYGDSFSLSLMFLADSTRLPRAKSYEDVGYIFVRDTFNIEQVKYMIKSQIGYTPEKETLQAICRHIQRLIAAYKEEDAYYASQDPKSAEGGLQELYDRAIARYERGEEFPHHSRFVQQVPAMQRFLNEQELTEAKEFQKVLNGHAYVEPESSVGNSGHLSKFNQRIDEEIRRRSLRRESLRKEERRKRLLELLDTDVEFRYLVANVLAAHDEIRTAYSEVELGHRLFGYTFDLNQYRTAVIPALEQLLQKYELKLFETNELYTIGKIYLDQDGMLPVPKAPFSREEGVIYYQDRVHNGIHSDIVMSVGKRYLYLSRQGKAPKKSYQHLEPARVHRDPKTVQEYIENELARLNNSGVVPDAHRKRIEEVLLLLYRRVINKRLKGMYDEMEGDESNPLRKEAYRYFADGLRCLALMEHEHYLTTLESLSHQPGLDAVRLEIQSLIQKHHFNFTKELAY